MMQNPHIFIGSSGRSKKNADHIAGILGKGAVCSLWWHEGSFPLGESALEALCKKTVMYDFAIFVAAADDLLSTADSPQWSMRDNVLFEHGLFTGALGRRRTFLFAPRTIKIPTDLAGVTIIYYNPLRYKSSIADGCSKVLSHIEREMKLTRFSLLPSASVAVNYYRNFVLPVCSALHAKAPSLTAGTVRPDINGFILNAVVPDEPQRDYKTLASVQRRKLGWQELEIVDPSHRVYCVSGTLRRGHLNIFDFPTGLSASYEAVRLYLGVDYIGAADDFMLCMRRELNCFKATLNILIQENPDTRDNARIIASPQSVASNAVKEQPQSHG